MKHSTRVLITLLLTNILLTGICCTRSQRNPSIGAQANASAVKPPPVDREIKVYPNGTYSPVEFLESGATTFANIKPPVTWLEYSGAANGGVRRVDFPPRIQAALNTYWNAFRHYHLLTHTPSQPADRTKASIENDEALSGLLNSLDAMRFSIDGKETRLTEEEVKEVALFQTSGLGKQFGEVRRKFPAEFTLDGSAE